jgi:hypothetical protein
MISGRIRKLFIVTMSFLGAGTMVATGMPGLFDPPGVDEGSESGTDGPNGAGSARPRARSCGTLPECDRRCGRGDAAACFRGAVGRLQGADGAPDPAGASVLLGKACEGGHPGGCTTLGMLCEQGDGVRQDAEKALDLYRQGCAGGDRTGCDRARALSPTDPTAAPPPDAAP